MNDQEPKYFTKFKEELNKKFEANTEQIANVSEGVTILKKDVGSLKKGANSLQRNVNSLKSGLKDVNKKLDAHAEQIASVSEKVTMLGVDMKRVETKIDNNIFKTSDIEQRTGKLEKVVFA